jgi:hypothetical protein
VKLFTARYADFDPAWGVAVRTSVGMPKFWRHGRLEHVRRLTPYGLLHVTDRAEFTRLYVKRLDRAGAEVIRARLQDISDAHDGRPLVLCCFEDLTWQGVWCHRTVLGVWLHDRLGVEVAELGRSAAAGGVQIDHGKVKRCR